MVVGFFGLYLVTACKGRKVLTGSFLTVHKIGATPEPLRTLSSFPYSQQWVQSRVYVTLLYAIRNAADLVAFARPLLDSSLVCFCLFISPLLVVHFI